MTSPLVWVLCGALVAGGLVALAEAVFGQPRSRQAAWSQRWQRAWSGGLDGAHRAGRRRVVLGAAGCTFLAAWLLSGVFTAAVLLGAAVVGVPWLLAPNTSVTVRISRLEALEAWTQRLSEILRLGFSLEQAIITSRKSAPPAIAGEVSDLAERLQAGWLPADALKDFSDQLDDITADKVCAGLILCAVDPGPGLAQVLADTAAAVRKEVTQRREIEAGRAKSRTAVRWMTLISLGLLLAGFLVPDYTKPYGTVLGQLVLALLGGAFAAVLWWTRKLSSHRPVPRFLIDDPRSQVRMPEVEQVTS
ncbi:type II secretion system F family protein [Streptomyces sp. NPDC001904]|uniref:type II secretion system F family protein n=1 Tax=Streptomyces sp. NPDC001904 TaxID=3154531 RepID=UPI00332B04BD